MRKLALLLFTIFLTALLALPAAAQNADDIVAKYFSARGGLSKIKSVQTERVTGSINFGPGVDGPFTVERKRPMKMHMDVTIAGKSMIRTYDGKSAGWIYNPFVPNPDVTPMSAEELANVDDEADFDGPFVDYQQKGNKLEYIGREMVDGKNAYKVKLTNKKGEISYFDFDPDTYLVLKWQGNRKIGDKEVPWESYFKDYRDVNGLKYPFVIESNAPGTEMMQTITAEKIETNIPLDDARFAKPVVAAPAPAPAEEPAKPTAGSNPQ